VATFAREWLPRYCVCLFAKSFSELNFDSLFLAISSLEQIEECFVFYFTVFTVKCTFAFCRSKITQKSLTEKKHLQGEDSASISKKRGPIPLKMRKIRPKETK